MNQNLKSLRMDSHEFSEQSDALKTQEDWKCGIVYIWNEKESRNEFQGIEVSFCADSISGPNSNPDSIIRYKSNETESTFDGMECLIELCSEKNGTGSRKLKTGNATIDDFAEKRHKESCDDEDDDVSFEVACCGELVAEQRKLSTLRTRRLIQLYRAEACLWQQSSPEYHNKTLRRKAMERIAETWNKETKCAASAANVGQLRMRIAALCQRYRRERKAIAESILGDCKRKKFGYFEDMRFLDNEKDQNRCHQDARKLFDDQNAKLLEIYSRFPVLWHRAFFAESRRDHLGRCKVALSSISKELKSMHIHLSPTAIKRRLSHLGQMYRNEKITFIRSNLDQKRFIPNFAHYWTMHAFLESHVAPLVCSACGKIFEKLNVFKRHFDSEKICKEATPEGRFLNKTDILAGNTTEEHPSTREHEIKLSCEKMQDDIDSNDLEQYPNSMGIALQSFGKRLTEEQIRYLISLYRDLAQLWDPDHFNYKLRDKQISAWKTLADEMNTRFSLKCNWKVFRRKMNDFVKYYKHEKGRIEMNRTCSKWLYYDDCKFLDRIYFSTANAKLGRKLDAKEQIIKICAVYESFPQLWNTQHELYSKRGKRLQHFEAMCQRLRDTGTSVELPMLRQILRKLRANYRSVKKQRLQAIQTKNFEFDPSALFEFYEHFNFLEDHVAPFKCVLCDGLAFENLNDLRGHALKEHNAASPKEEKLPVKNRDATSFTCHLCEARFACKYNLQNHLKRHFGQRNFGCNYCSKRFYRAGDLKVHVRIHTKETPFVCEVCNTGFVSGSKLNQHLKRHSNNHRNFECTHCGKKFFTKSNLQHHLKRHLKIRDKMCPFCGVLSSGSAFYAHLKLHDETKRYVCNVCKARFAQHAGLYKHKKKCHDIYQM